MAKRPARKTKRKQSASSRPAPKGKRRRSASPLRPARGNKLEQSAAPSGSLPSAEVKQPAYPSPPVRKLRVYAFDPQAASALRSVRYAYATIALPWEESFEDPLEPGPINDYLEVI